MTFCDSVHATFILCNLDTHVLPKYMVYADLQIFLPLYFTVNNNHNLLGTSKLMPVGRYYTRLNPQLQQVLDCSSVVALLYSIGALFQNIL